MFARIGRGAACHYILTPLLAGRLTISQHSAYQRKFKLLPVRLADI